MTLTPTVTYTLYCVYPCSQLLLKQRDQSLPLQGRASHRKISQRLQELFFLGRIFAVLSLSKRLGIQECTWSPNKAVELSGLRTWRDKTGDLGALEHNNFCPEMTLRSRARIQADGADKWTPSPIRGRVKGQVLLGTGGNMECGVARLQ